MKSKNKVYDKYSEFDGISISVNDYNKFIKGSNNLYLKFDNFKDFEKFFNEVKSCFEQVRRLKGD